MSENSRPSNRWKSGAMNPQASVPSVPSPAHSRPESLAFNCSSTSMVPRIRTAALRKSFLARTCTKTSSARSERECSSIPHALYRHTFFACLRFRARQNDRFEIGHGDRELHISPSAASCQTGSRRALHVAPLAESHLARGAGQIHPFACCTIIGRPGDLEMSDLQSWYDCSDRRRGARGRSLRNGRTIERGADYSQVPDSFSPPTSPSVLLALPSGVNSPPALRATPRCQAGKSFPC